MIQFLILLSAGGTSKFPVVLIAPDMETAEEMGRTIATESGLVFSSAKQLGRISVSQN